MQELPGKWPAFILPGSLPPAPGYRLPQGFVLCDRFRIVRFIAQGGMGSVYEAEDLELRERVAIKTLRSEIVEDPKLLERFRREAQLARRVTHPNVCRIYDVFRQEVDARRPQSDVVFLVMELLHGETLLQRIRDKGPFSHEESLPIVRQLADALDAAHRASVVHRDFKSANIILDPSRETPGEVRAVVTDFGIARSLEPDTDGRSSELTEKGEAIGTRDYAAPEQLLGGEVTPAADVYAFGVVLYEMLTGHRPYEGNEPATVRFEHPPLPPGDLVAAIPGRVSSAVVRCLARDPAQRFARAADVLAAIAGRPQRRVSPIVAATALVLAAAALVLVAIKVRPRSSEPAGFASAVQLTASSRLDAWPVFTADDSGVVYASERTGSFELYLQPLENGARELRLTSDGLQNLQPAVSPDGRTIAYTSRGRGGIWIIPSAGGAPRQLSTFGARPAFSPDGALVAFQSESPAGAGPMELGGMPPSVLWLVAAQGGKPRRFTTPGVPPGGHGSPVFTPDGKWLVFTAFQPEWSKLWAIPIAGGAPVPLPVSSSPYSFDPVVARDGTLFFGSITEESQYGIRRVAMDWRSGGPSGAATEVISSGAVIPRHLTLTRDGKKLAYAALALRTNLEALSLDAEGRPAGTPRALTSEAARNSRPAFSPDGGRIAFTKWRTGVNVDVWLHDVASGAAEQVTTDKAEDTIPSWFPSGERIAFQSSRLGHPALFGKNLPDGREELLLDVGPDMEMRAPRLSPDGKLVAFNSRRAGGTINVWIAPLGGGAPRQVTFDRELAGFPSWSPDGRVLAVQVRRGEDRQVGIVPAGGGPIELLTDAPGQSWCDGFSPDGAKVVFAGLRAGVWNIYWVSRATRETRQLTFQQNPNGYMRYPAWSPRGDLVVYESAETTGNVWMLSK